MTNLLKKDETPVIQKKAIPEFKSIIEEKDDSMTHNQSKKQTPEPQRLETKITE